MSTAAQQEATTDTPTDATTDSPDAPASGTANVDTSISTSY
jgi:hypothetical protein